MKNVLITDLTDKVIVITGAAGVICGSIAKSLSTSGAKIALLDINILQAQKTADIINNAGGIAKVYETNVLNKQNLIDVKKEIEKDFGQCDILINGAGGNNKMATTDNEFCESIKNVDKDFFSLDEDSIRFVFDLNFIGTFLPTQVFASGMIGKKGSNILNISSMNAFTPLTKIPAYSAAKASVSNFTQWLAVHFAKVGIRVNAIAPGFFVTHQNKDLLYDEKGNPTERTNKILTATPVGRFGEVEELISMVKLLITEEYASFITGIVVPIDGGFSAFSGV